MLNTHSRKRIACALFLMSALAVARAQTKQMPTGLPNVFANKPSSCKYYVNGTLGVDTLMPNTQGTGTGSNAFRSLAFAHTQLTNYVTGNPSHGNLAVCIESGTYYAPDYTVDMSPNPVTTQTTAVQKPTLDIKVAGTPTGQLWFMGAPGEAQPVLIQSGYNGIQFEQTAQYITIYGLIVQGQDVVAMIPSGTLARRNASSAGWPFYDGSCIGAAGEYPVGMNLSPSVISPYTPQHITILSNKVMNCGGGGISFKLADFITIENNMVYQNSYWSIYDTSGISVLDSVDVDGAYRGNEIKNYVVNNFIFGNQNERNNGTDGEGIIIDTNLNSNSPGNPVIHNNTGVIVTPPEYQGTTLVGNNVLWGNGGAALEAFHSQYVDFYCNSTYQNVVDSKRAADQEIFLNVSTNINVVNNVAVSSSNRYPLGGTTFPNGYIDSGNNVLFVNTTGAQPVGWFPSWVSAYTAYSATNPDYANPAPGSPGSIDLTPGSATVTAGNGCTYMGSFCTATIAQDVKFVTRSAVPYPSGAYYTTH
jgi:hypothetical protein